MGLYAEAREAYIGMRFSEALALFTQAQDLKPTDKAVAVHLARASHYLQTPPPDDWNGVHVMTTK